MKGNSIKTNELNNTIFLCESSLASPLLSVIVTIYNSEKYLEECVESLFSQTLNGIEYIFIDDASSDNSIVNLQNLIKKYPDRQGSVTIALHKENRGVSLTRKEGIDLAKGKWVIFCDSDDRVKVEAYQKMLNKAELVGADIVGCGFLYFGESSNSKKVLQGEGEMDSLEMLKRICGIYTVAFHGSLCNKMIRRTLYDTVVFPKNLSYCEDELAMMQILLGMPKITMIGEAFYEYRKHDNSLVSGKDTGMLKQIRIIIPFVKNLCKGATDEQKHALNVKVTTYLYRLLKSKALKVESLSVSYGEYRKFVKDNRRLNALESFHLNLALKGRSISADIIGKCNFLGYRLIKKISSFIKV